MIGGELTSAVRRLIAMFRPRHSPPTSDWTDYNAHDPGVTVVELLAFIAEALLVVAAVRRWRSRRCHRTLRPGTTSNRNEVDRSRC